MIFKYEDITISYKIELNNLNNIKAHALSFIKGANVKPDNTFKYSSINENLITLVPENDEEVIFLNKKVMEDKSVIIENWEVCRGNIFSLTTSSNNSVFPGWYNMGNGINGLIFSDNRDQRISTTFELGNKYKPNSPIYLELGYIPMSPSNGNILFKIEYSKAVPNSGLNVLTDSNIETLLVSNNNNVGVYKNLVIELDNSNLDTDSVIMVNIGRLGKHNTDTYYGTFSLLTASVRFKLSDTIGIGE